MKAEIVLAFVCAIFAQIGLVQAQQPVLKLVQEWKTMQFQFPNESARLAALQSKQFIPGNGFALDMDVQYRAEGKTRIFVTTPRFSDGVPITLGVINREQGSSQAPIQAYPDYSWHINQGKNCDGITSVLRVAIDNCDRLWVLDTGKIDTKQVCPAQLLAFNLRTDTLIHRHRFTTAYDPDSLLVTPIVDVQDGKCEDTFVYIADITTFAMIVFSLASRTSWRVTDKYMYPNPFQGTYNIAGESFDLMDGILGMALSPYRDAKNDKILYFHALSSISEQTVKTSSLKNSTLWSDGLFHPSEFKLLPGRRSSQSAAEAIDNDGIMYFGLASENAIACWNTAVPFVKENIVIIAQDNVRLQFPSGIKIVNNLKGGQEIWVVTCRFQKIMNGSMSKDEVNYRILAANVKDLVRGTKCASPNLVSFPNSVNYGAANYH